jgi:nitrogen-specific signal transduction histidine kinase
MAEMLQPTSSTTTDFSPETAALLADIRLGLARVVHDVNNPLSIISGNAQLLCELARMMELDPDLAKPIADIEEASRMLAERIAVLALLKEQLRTALNEVDSL